jgi:glyoxylase-like metal-dependent hydrolase (beta-lactamase superfamily II)
MSSKHWRTVSAWSKAGIGTSVVLELKSPPSSSSSSSSSSGGDATNPSTAKSTGAGQRVVFDIGATPSIDDAIPARYVFLSHGHVDHVGALFGHARAHAVTYGG